jgi:hypothetical protein
MAYRCVAESIDGLVQQVAVSYLARGYFFHVAGTVPAGKDPATVDGKLVAKYRIDANQKERCRRKRAGFANVQYIRHGRFFLLLATHGKHPFFEEEAGQVRDARRVPIKLSGYSLSVRNGRVSVRIEPGEYRRLKAWFLERACHRSAATLAADFAGVGFQPYAPVRVQLLNIWRAVNRARQAAGFDRVPIEAVPWRRRILRPFGEPQECGDASDYRLGAA